VHTKIPFLFAVAESTQRYEGMTKRASRQAAARTSLCLLAALVLSCVTSGSNKVLILAQPEPLGYGDYGDNFADSPDSLVSIARRIKRMDISTATRKHGTFYVCVCARVQKFGLACSTLLMGAHGCLLVKLCDSTC